MKRRIVLLGLLAAALLPSTAHADRYALQGGCYTLKSDATGGSAGPFRMQAVTLGRYMLYDGQVVALAPDGRTVERHATPDITADWTVDDATGGAFTVTATRSGAPLGVAADGTLTTGTPGALRFVPADGCPTFPEAEVNATGAPATGPTPYSQVRGFIDAHMHLMGFEMFGGELHCGRPWDPYGVTVALKGCDQTEVPSPLIETFLSGDKTTPLHDPVGWPTFHDWPGPETLSHEQAYWKWLERAWRGGLRIFVNLAVENNALCEAYPHRKPGYNCNEMDSVRRETRDLHELEKYIDAQYGGPGKGWFRIVEDPFEARRVINAGKLAVVPGIEVSNLFNCGDRNGVPQCTDADVDSRLDEAYNKLGIRDMELINKFDNGFGGVAGDNGTTGIVVNAGNFLETGHFWDLQTCKGPAEESDKEQLTLPGQARDVLIGDLLQKLVPGGTLPAYPAGPHCNARGLTALGEHLVRRMIEKRMIIDPDHLSVLARKQLLSIVEAARYSGIVSSHSWSTSDAYPRIYKLGGFVTPYAGNSTTFASAWRKLRAERDPRFFWGIGWGADMNGFGGQGLPRHGANPVTYPFKSFDGKVTFDRERTGDRVFDINKDGVAHYGLYPDWVEDLRHIAGDQIVSDLANGPEAYLEMWERAIGITPSDDCRSARTRFTGAGLGGLLLGAPAEEVLRGAGQPVSRPGRVWTYCVKAADGTRGRVRGVFDAAGRLALVTSTARHHRADGIGAGSAARGLRGARSVGGGVFVKAAPRGRSFVFGVRGGRVRFAGVAMRSLAVKPARLRAALRAARL